MHTHYHLCIITGVKSEKEQRKEVEKTHAVSVGWKRLPYIKWRTEANSVLYCIVLYKNFLTWPK